MTTGQYGLEFWGEIIVGFYPSDRAVEKLNAKKTFMEEKSAYSELQLYPSVTICHNPGDVRSE